MGRCDAEALPVAFFDLILCSVGLDTQLVVELRFFHHCGDARKSTLEQKRSCVILVEPCDRGDCKLGRLRGERGNLCAQYTEPLRNLVELVNRSFKRDPWSMA